MRKIIYTTLITLVSLVISSYLLGRVVLDQYFNKEYYYTPNLTGMTVEEVGEKIPGKEVTVVVTGQDYSPYPVGEIYRQDPEENHVVKRGRKVKVWVSLGEDFYKIPDFKGQQLFEIKSMLERNRIKIRSISRVESPLAYNSIIGTTPSIGEYTNPKDGVALLVSGSVSSKVEIIPDIIGYSLPEATQMLKKNSIFVGEVRRVKMEGLEPGIVIDTSVGVNSKVLSGTTINLDVTE